MTIPYDTELYVVTSWNGAGTPIVFSSKEACEATISAYDTFRANNVMPWVYDREAVNGDRILDLFRNGVRPWRVYLSTELKIVSIRAIPLHHVTLKMVTERYSNGAPRYLEIWAADKGFAEVHVNNLLQTSDRVKLLLDIDTEWTFEAWAKEQGYVPTYGKPGVQPNTPGLEDEVNFYDDEQVEKQKTILQAEVPAREEPSTVHRQPQPPAMIPGFGKVVNLGDLR